MKVGDRVSKSPMWIYETAYGQVIKLTKECIVVQWDGVNGDWHYPHEQAHLLNVIDDS
tara:strand:- start:146 stop:319 length:174 start_codon:yes stop_codon:yes gene_type:complete